MATHNEEDIVRYVDDEMSPAERSQMEADLAQDAALAADVQLYVELRAELAERLSEDAGGIALKETLTRLTGEYFAKGDAAQGNPVRENEATGNDGIGNDGTENALKANAAKGSSAKVVSFRKYFVGVAAAASIIIVAVMLWPSTKGNYMDQFGGAQMVGPTERGDGNDTLMQAASAYFNAKEFAQALPLLDRVIAADSSNQEAIFYRGVAKLRTGDTIMGRSDLSKVYSGTSLFKYEAAFFMGLSYAEADRAKALEWIEKIPEGAPGWEKAQALRKKIK